MVFETNSQQSAYILHHKPTATDLSLEHEGWGPWSIIAFISITATQLDNRVDFREAQNISMQPIWRNGI